jgi:hypothetical protein
VNVNNGIVKLIEAQKNLKYFVFNLPMIIGFHNIVRCLHYSQPLTYNSNEIQDTQRTQENTESESQPFIDKSSAHYLSYYNF